MGQLTYPRTAETIAARARMALAAYRAVPGPEATHHLERSLHDMWQYGYFALRNDDKSPWTRTSQQLFNALQLLKPATSEHTVQPADAARDAARAAADATHRFEQAAAVTPGPAPEPLYTRAEAERAADAAFDCLSEYIRLDHWNDRRFVTRAFLAFLDNPDSPYPYKSHDTADDSDDEDDDGDQEPEPELSPEETGERENALLYWLGPRTDTPPTNP
ncbi:hypothetical protein [Streptomyces sp. NPDC055140]